MAGFPKAGMDDSKRPWLRKLADPVSLSLNVLEQQGPGPQQTERLFCSVSSKRETEIFRADEELSFSAM
jgi:hypothetical protein